MLFYVDKEYPNETCVMERVLMRHSSEDGLYHLELVELADERRTLGFEVNNTDKGGSRGLTSITAGFNSFVEAREYFLTCTKLERLPHHPEVKGAVDIEKRNTPIEIDDGAIDSVIEKVRLLKENLVEIEPLMNFSETVSAGLQSGAVKSMQPDDSILLWYLDAKIAETYASLIELVSKRLDVTL